MFLGQVTLRNPYLVYEGDKSYIVTSKGPRGQDHGHRISPQAVAYLRERLRGRSVTVGQATSIIEPVAERFKLPYTFGDKVRYSAQYVLIVLVVLGQATVDKEERSYVYSIRS